MRRNQKRSLPNPLIGLVLSVLALIALALAFHGELPFRNHYTVDAVVPTANNLRKNSPVRIAGVNVGKVTKIEDLGDGSTAARIEMRIDDSGLPLHDDAQVRIRPRIFLEGNFFVDLAPGSPSAPVVDEGHTFPINQAKAPVQIDQVLTALQSDTRADLKKLLVSLSTAYDGGGAKGFNRSIPYWESAYKNSALVNDATLGTAEHDLSGYIKGAGAAAEALDADPGKLKSLITDLNRTAGAFASEDDALRDTLEELPRTLGAGLPALRALNTAFPPVRRLAVALRPGTRSSGPALDASVPLVRQLRGLVSRPEARGLAADLRPTVRSLAALNGATPPLLREGRALSSCNNEVVLPWTKDTIEDKQFPASGPVFEDSVKTLPGLAGESRSGDANGQWFRVLANAGNYATPNGAGQVLLSGQPLMGYNPRPPKERSAMRHDVACETQQPPDLRSIPGTMNGQKRAQVPASRQGDYLKIQGDAMAWLKLQLDANPLTKDVKVGSPAIPAAKVEQLAAGIRAKARAKARSGGPMMKVIRKNLTNFAAVIGLMVIAAGVGGYILSNQRLRFPWEGKVFKLEAEFSTAQAVTPGQGQTVRVSGVRIGDIGKVELVNGRAVVTMDLEPEFKDLVHTDATALLRPKTGLKDMFIELDPGSDGAPVAKERFRMPAANTLPDVNPDEILSALDADSRDYLRLLVSGAGRGLETRGTSLREVFKRFEPTHRDLARVTRAVATRRENLRRLIHSLNGLNGELASKRGDLTELVSTSADVFEAFASEQASISDSVRKLPATLRQTTQTLGKVERYANVLGPAAEELRPVGPALEIANKAVIPFAKEATPTLRTKIRPFVREARPVVRSLRPATANLTSATPDLTRTFKVFNSFFNMLGYNARGREAPEDPNRDEGYLFWLAWLQHNGSAVFSTSDANGPLRALTVAGTCNTIRNTAQNNPPLNMVMAPALLDPTICAAEGNG